MRAAYDFSPLYRSMVGADHMAELIQNALKGGGGGDHPPYDIEKIGVHAYRITLATAGFRKDELEITAEPNLLVVRGRKTAEGAAGHVLHRGLAQRDFERRFELADHIVVRDAAYADGLLTIELEREMPEALKPRTIEIGRPAGGTLSRLMDTRRRPRKAA
ncbi:MAG: Hsp20 family protein [Pseudomonadota bacterium]